MSQKSDKPSQKRRAILQGSLAAPVVLTVSSPSAATMTTIGRCMANDLAKGNPAYLVPTDDTWMRIPVTVYSLDKGDGKTTGLVFYDQYLQDHVTIDTFTPQNIKDLSHLGWSESNRHTRYGLQWVDETSKTASTQIRWQPNGWRPVTDSCWTSFK